MSNTTRYVLGSSHKAVATVMGAMYPNQPYVYIHDTFQWVGLTDDEKLNIIFSDIDWATTNRALATLVIRFFKDYIHDNPDQTDIDMKVFEKFIGVENIGKEEKVTRKKTNSIYPRSHEFILSVLPKRTEDFIIREAEIDTPLEGPPTITLTLLLPTRDT